MPDTPAFHFPPDVFNAMFDAIPLLTRGRKDVILFFRGCGADGALLSTIERRLDADPTFSKYHATREILTHLNTLGDVGIGARRQVVKRLSEWDEFTSCYPDNQLKAQGAVAAVRELVNRKDSFTRMQLAHEDELRRHREVKAAELQANAVKREAVEQVRTELFRQFGETDAHRRGKALEGILNRLFQTSDIMVSEAFVVVDGGSSGVIEQIDGAVELDGHIYLVEMKWWSERLGRAEVANHLVSVYGRADAGGIFISASGFHESAITVCKTALSHRTVVLVELREIVDALNKDHPVRELLRSKIRAATLTKRPLVFPLDS